MPEPIRNEEDVNREQSLCPYKVPGINKLNRCSNCPGASRSPLQHRRCPLDVAEPNIFRAPVDPVNLSASSSGKGKEKEPETELLTYEARKLSLADPSASGSCSAVTSGVPSQEDVVSKRKLENHQMYILGREFQDLSVQEWTINKPTRPFVDSPDVHLNKRLCLMIRISETELMQNPEQQMMQNPAEHQRMQFNPEENHSAGRASTSTTTAAIPGFSMDIDVGVYTCCYSMELEEPK